VGSVGDGFPRPTPKEDESPDTLLRWEDVVCDAFVNGEMVIVFDVARGFTFPRDKDRKKFTGIVDKMQGADASDPIAQQRAQMTSQDLPRAPQTAIPLLQQVLAHCARERKPIPCLLILPDADALCPSSEGSPAGNASGNISLALVQLAGASVFRLAGHRILLSAPAIQSVDERLRRHDAPVKIVRVERPSQKERMAFLERITEDMGEIDQKIIQVQEVLSVLRRQERERAAEQHEIKSKELACLDAETQTDPDVARLEQEVEEAHRAFEEEGVREDARKNATIARVTKELERLKRQQEADPDLQSMEVTPENFGRMVIGGQISWTAPEVCAEWMTIFGTCQKPAAIHLETSKGIRLMGTSGEPILYSINPNGTSWTSRPSKDAPPALCALHQNVRVIYLSPAAMKIRKEIRRLTHQCREILPSDEFTHACDVWRQKEEQLAQRQEVLRMSQGERRQRIVDELARLEAMLKNPTSDAITTRHAELEELRRDKQRRETMDLRIFPQPYEGAEEIARLCQGLGYRDLLEIFLSAYAENRVVTSAETLDARITILRRTYGHLMDIVDPAYGFEGIAGLRHIKAFLSHVQAWMQSGDMRRVPMGCLFIGPPGTGKTAVAEAFARECGVLFVKIRNVRTMWVGETERKMEETFAALKSLAPVVVLRDEVDEEDSGRDAFQGDSGVSARLRRGWMEFLSDPKIRGKIFVISCSNRPDRLDAALIRSGRTDERIPLLMPDRDTRLELFPVMLKRYGYTSTVKDFGPLADTTNGWSGADIEVIVRLAAQYALEDGREVVEERDLEQAIQDFLPAASQEQIAKMTLAAIKYTSSRRWLPEGYETIVAQQEMVLRGERMPPPKGPHQKLI
jgi:SpoVK/Ycf46/Vps4 family AAA+-type ATPase